MSSSAERKEKTCINSNCMRNITLGFPETVPWDLALLQLILFNSSRDSLLDLLPIRGIHVEGLLQYYIVYYICMGNVSPAQTGLFFTYDAFSFFWWPRRS
jgi:hypothetical protein